MATSPLGKEELARRKRVLEDCLREGYRPLGRGSTANSKGSAIQEAARRLGIAHGALHHTVRSGFIKPNWDLFKPIERPARPHLTALPPDERREVVQLRDRVKFLEAQMKEIERDNISITEVRKQIFRLAEHDPTPPEWLIGKKHASKGITGVPSVIWSDWHIGETVSLSEMNGINEFNLSICERRIRRLVERVIDLCFCHMVAPNKYPGIVVNLIGDIISGGIHPDLAETDEDELFPIIIWAVDRLIWALTALADKFGRVFVACAPGNHGRVLDKKPRAKAYTHRNADWLIYTMLERHFATAKDRRVQFSIPASGEVLYSIYDHRYLAVHGDDLGVKGGDGIIGVLGPIARGEIKVRHSSAQIGRDYDTLLMGHWHQTLWLPRAIVNNTLKGPDEYSRRFLRATPSPPAQVLWFTHPRYGITCRWEVLLESDETPRVGNWVAWKEHELA